MSDEGNKNQASGTAGNAGIGLGGQDGVAFHSANIPEKRDIFAEQNEHSAKKKQEHAADRKRFFRIAMIVAGVVVGVLLAWLIIFLIMRLAKTSDITATSDDEYGTPVGVLEAREILDKNNDDMSKVQEYFDEQIESEKDISKKNDIALLAMEFYDYYLEDEMAIATAELVDPETMNQWQLANYTARLHNLYNDLGDFEKSAYWDSYYEERYSSEEYSEDSEEASSVNDDIEMEGED